MTPLSASGGRSGAVPRTLTLVPIRPSPAAFAPFGWLPVDDTDPVDTTHGLVFADQDPHLNVIVHHPGEVDRDGDRLRCRRLFRHRRHTQALTVIGPPAVLVVAAADTDLRGPDAHAQLRAFHLEQPDTVVLHAGTWHWGPYPCGSAPARLLNLQARSYLDDNDHVDLLPGMAVWVAVSPG